MNLKAAEEPQPHSEQEHQRYHGKKSIYHSRPDYSKPLFHFTEEQRRSIRRRLNLLYGTAETDRWMPEVERICRVHCAHKSTETLMLETGLNPLERFTQEDVILITYGDLIHGKDRSPLKTLSKFCGLHFEGCINTLHILPFFPYSSDRGFAVVDFDSVDPRLGTWADMEDLEERYKLMFDGVINHVSSKSRWFQEFLNGHPHYREYFVSFQDPEELEPRDRNLIFRPRTSDVLTPFETLEGKRFVWTTFSGDQVDLNYQNPEVLIRVLEVLLHYVRHGADLLRLDAVTYLWRRPGTRCVHLPETHETVKLIRDVLSAVAPDVSLVTETNVPHKENIAYFGNGHDEAHLIYNFALPPLLLHTFYQSDATRLSAWASTLNPPSGATGFLNFLDSHDGLGLMAVRGILSEKEIQALVSRAEAHGGLISHRTEGETSTPYEINITWYSALNKEGGEETLALQVQRFLASRVIAMALRGVPGIYLHSLFGTRNDREAVLKSGVKRDINRRTVDYDAVLAAMEDPSTSISMIMNGLKHLLKVRTKERCFHPRGPQKVLNLGPQCFAILRQTPEQDRGLLAITNITDQVVTIRVPLDEYVQESLRDDLTEAPEAKRTWIDLLSMQVFIFYGDEISLTLPAYGFVWLVNSEGSQSFLPSADSRCNEKGEVSPTQNPSFLASKPT